MKLSLFDDYRIGVWGRKDSIVDVTNVLSANPAAADRMNFLIQEWPTVERSVRDAAQSVGVPRSDVTFRAVQPRPTKIIAAPVNHGPHRDEMIAAGAFADPPGTIEKYVAFLKAPSSIVGPDAMIVLPDRVRRIDHEAELGVVMGAQARGLSRDAALASVFGYMPLIDVTMRGDEDRSYRKSFDSFTPIGPAIVTADEVADLSTLNLRLSVNGVIRQNGWLRDLIYDVPRLIEVYSKHMTLQPGDIIASGTPEGVGPLHPGDTVMLEISGMPTLSIGVSAEVAEERPRNAHHTSTLRKDS